MCSFSRSCSKNGCFYQDTQSSNTTHFISRCRHHLKVALRLGVFDRKLLLSVLLPCRSLAWIACASSCRLIAGGHSHHADINLKGAILHVFGDTIQAIGVAIAAALIWGHQVQQPTFAAGMHYVLWSCKCPGLNVIVSIHCLVEWLLLTKLQVFHNIDTSCHTVKAGSLLNNQTCLFCIKYPL